MGQQYEKRIKMMYRLDRADARLSLPAPVYTPVGAQREIDYAM
ncbi:hypothetical protein IAD21_02773 [Abditibacteriota bacterium]|nr:hypothetical protein IAD21_02773 [Abditibacteriota bacterium]